MPASRGGPPFFLGLVRSGEFRPPAVVVAKRGDAADAASYWPASSSRRRIRARKHASPRRRGGPGGAEIAVFERVAHRPKILDQSASRLAYPSRAMSWRAFASWSSWAEVRSPASTSPRKSIWVAELWPSRCRALTATSRRFSRGSSTPTSCRCTRSATTRKAVCAVLCMPYFGGANLAQVLEASGGLIPTHHDGRSLVKALDQVSRNFTSQSNRAFPGSGSAAPEASAREPKPDRIARSRLRISRGTAARKATVRRDFDHSFRAGSARVPCPAARVLEQEGDHDQPSRQFLHGASAIQAAVWIVARLADGLEHAHSRGLAPPRSEAVEHPAGRRRNADAARFQSVRRALPQPARDRDPPRLRGRHASLHVARTPRRIQSPRVDASRGRRRAIRHLRARVDPVRDAGRRASAFPRRRPAARCRARSSC